MTKQHPEESFKDRILDSLKDPKTKSDNKKHNSYFEESKQMDGQEESAKETRRTRASSSQKKTEKNQSEFYEEPITNNIEKRRATRKKEDKIVNKIVLIVVLAFIFIGGILGFSMYRFVAGGLQPLDSKNTEKIEVQIPTGSSNKTIGEILEKDKIIKSGMIFNYFTKFNNLTGFQAGNYEFSPSMTLDEISKQLQNGGSGAVNSDAKVVIKEGDDIDKIGDTLAKETNIKKEEFIALMQDQAFFDKMHERYPELLDSAATAEGVRYRLEGYLFPATYDYYRGDSLEDVVSQMVDKSNTVLSKYYEDIHNKNLTVQQALTLASLVEKEGIKEEDRRNIAQVFFNRLAIDMPLQSDISILYALGEHKELVTEADTMIDSPYNLYQNTGYSPGPFDSPSEQALEAVLNPIPNNYYYFVADLETQQVYFAETYDQHMALVEKYVNKTN